MTTKNSKYYQLFLPVFKQGDDLHHYLKANPKEPAKALLGLAEQYEAAASICRRVAGVVVEAPAGSVKINADTHWIGIQAPPASFAGLVTDKVVTIPNYLDEKDGEDSDVGDDDLFEG